MILSAQTIPRSIVEPFVETKTIHPESGMSYGLSAAGYDIRVAQAMVLPKGLCVLASSLERFAMPNDVLGVVHDKSTLARMGVAVQNTVIEPGWHGWLTLELTNHADEPVTLIFGQPIAQILFHRLDQPTDTPYSGKYQNQENRPVSAIREG